MGPLLYNCTLSIKLRSQTFGADNLAVIVVGSSYFTRIGASRTNNIHKDLVTSLQVYEK